MSIILKNYPSLHEDFQYEYLYLIQYQFGTIPKVNICVTGVPEGDGKETGTGKKKSEGITVVKFQNYDLAFFACVWGIARGEVSLKKELRTQFQLVLQYLCVLRAYFIANNEDIYQGFLRNDFQFQESTL